MTRMNLARIGAGLAIVLTFAPPARPQKEPKQTPENTITLQFPTSVKAQTFARPVTFYIHDVIDRSGDPQPMLVFRGRGGAYLDREPREVVRQALTECLKSAGLLAENETSATHTLTVYVFHFGLAEGSGFEFFSKVDLNVVVKEMASGRSTQVQALGTSIEQTAIRKKKIMERVKANLEEALAAALSNFLRGKKLRDAVETIAASRAPQLAS